MKNKILSIGAGLGVLTIGLLVVFASVYKTREIQQGKVIGANVEVRQMERTEAENETMVHYSLPYPGVLPTSPLYSLKMVRDRVREMATLNEMNRANLLLEYADKRIAAGQELIRQGEGERAIEVFMRGTDYETKLVDLMDEMKERGVNVGELANKSELAIRLHEQIVEKAVTQLSGGTETLEQELNMIKDNYNRVVKILERE